MNWSCESWRAGMKTNKRSEGGRGRTLVSNEGRRQTKEPWFFEANDTEHRVQRRVTENYCFTKHQFNLQGKFTKTVYKIILLMFLIIDHFVEIWTHFYYTIHHIIMNVLCK